MIRPLAIDHIVLRTDLYAELINFYVDVLGCSIERETTQEFGLTQLRAGNALIDIVDVRGKLGKKGGSAPTEMGNNVDHFCIQVEPIKESELRNGPRFSDSRLSVFCLSDYAASGKIVSPKYALSGVFSMPWCFRSEL